MILLVLVIFPPSDTLFVLIELKPLLLQFLLKWLNFKLQIIYDNILLFFILLINLLLIYIFILFFIIRFFCGVLRILYCIVKSLGKILKVLFIIENFQIWCFLIWWLIKEGIISVTFGPIKGFAQIRSFLERLNFVYYWQIFNRELVLAWISYWAISLFRE